MIWQDITLSVGNFILAAALLPSVFGKNKPSVWTSLTTGCILFSFFIAFMSMHLIASAAAVGTCSVLWLLLWAQKARQ